LVGPDFFISGLVFASHDIEVGSFEESTVSPHTGLIFQFVVGELYSLSMFYCQVWW